MDRITKSDFKVDPIIKNYDDLYGSFSWDDARKDVTFFADGTTNIAYNAVDRHCESGNGSKVALHWLGKDDEKLTLTYDDIKKDSNQFANLLLKLGVNKGDRVFLFLPRIPELYTSFLGILKTGAIASTLFSAFGEDALQDRLQDSGASIVVTDKSLLGRVDKVKGNLPDLKHIIVVTDEELSGDKRYVDYKQSIVDMPCEFEIAHMGEKEYAFMLYTSGTTGKPKGVVHTHGDIVQEHMTTKYVLDVREGDVYWCTADAGWVTGIVYGIIGPWSNKVPILVDEGRFSPERWFKIIQDYKVTVWYTAPTAIRMIMGRGGDELIKKYDLSSVRYACSVGEPLNPEAVTWALEKLGLPFHDNWWQTETGSIMIANYITMDIKPGSMGRPIPGVVASIIDDKGNELPRGTEGNLVIKRGWPSMMITIWGNEERYKKCFVGDWYVSGDRARQDEEGYFWFIGRADDVIKTAGHRVGPFEVESALVEHPLITEAGVIGKPDEVYGEIIKAFVSLKEGVEANDALKEDIQKFIKKKLSGHAYPKEIEFRQNLPKTRSGKIMRRLLKAQELGEDIGDTSTLSDD